MAAFGSVRSVSWLALISRFVAEGQYTQLRASTLAGLQINKDVVMLVEEGTIDEHHPSA